MMKMSHVISLVILVSFTGGLSAYETEYKPSKRARRVKSALLHITIVASANLRRLLAIYTKVFIVVCLFSSLLSSWYFRDTHQ